MTDEAELIRQLVAAHRSGVAEVDATPFSTIDRPAAYRIQAGVAAALGATPGMLKTAIHADGVGIAAPIYAANVGNSGAMRLPFSRVLGLELEVGLVLARDLSSEVANADEIDIVEAIDHYFVGIEVCGTRYRNRGDAGPMGGLADGTSAFGYVIDPSPRDSGADIDNFDVHLALDGVQLHSGLAKHSFGSVLASFIAYAKNQQPAYPLKAGTIVTTGSLCGLVPVPGPGRVVGSLGIHTVEFDLV